MYFRTNNFYLWLGETHLLCVICNSCFVYTFRVALFKIIFILLFADVSSYSSLCSKFDSSEKIFLLSITLLESGCSLENLSLGLINTDDLVFTIGQTRMCGYNEVCKLFETHYD